MAPGVREGGGKKVEVGEPLEGSRIWSSEEHSLLILHGLPRESGCGGWALGDLRLLPMWAGLLGAQAGGERSDLHSSWFLIQMAQVF